MQQNVSSFYQENQIRTADQGRLIVMLYERAIFSLKQAQEKIVAGDYYQRNQLILKAQNIILELMNTLNFEAGKIAYSLQSLYNYMIRRLILARALINRPDLLILDDWGLAPLNQAERNDLLEVLDDRVGTRSTVITSQLPVEHWHAYLNDPTLADAILDRVLHAAHKLLLAGESLRKPEKSKS